MNNFKQRVANKLAVVKLKDPTKENAFFDHEATLITFSVEDMFRESQPKALTTCEAMKVKKQVKFGDIEFEGVDIKDFSGLDSDNIVLVLGKGRARVYSKDERKYVGEILKGEDDSYFLPNGQCFWVGITPELCLPSVIKHNRFKDWFKTFLP